MDILECILITFGIFFGISVLGTVIFALKTRGDKKINDKGTIRTRNSKLLQGFFLGFALLVFFGGAAGCIYCAIADAENTTVTTVAIIVVSIVAFSALGLFGFLYVHFNYVISTDEGLEVHSLFRKKKFYRYEDILYFHDTTSLGLMGGLVGYGKHGKKNFCRGGSCDWGE